MVDEGQLDHSLPHMSVWTACRQLELDRLCQTGILSLGVDGAIGPHAKTGIPAQEEHAITPHTVVKLHCGGREGEAGDGRWGEA